ncbi:MAG TPA: protein kinase [Gemmatimonadaceae bacterium]
MKDSYSVERELSGGGMSRVFLAEERALGRKVVIKVLPAELAGQVSTDRFKREISIAARLQHPNILPLLSAGEIGGLPYFTMPFVEGESLRHRVVRGGELPLHEAVRFLREVASALSAAHRAGVVHRDIKPDNVLISGGEAMVTDFGVAKALQASSTSNDSVITSIGIALGTPAYMAPEQASADPSADHRADLYAWGVMAYELLTGQPPFTGRSPQGMIAAHVTETPEELSRRRPGIPPALSALVMRCLAKRPADRPQSADELLHVLDSLSTPSTGSLPSDSPTTTTTAGKGRRALLFAVASGIVLLVATGALIIARRGDAAAAVPESVAVLPFENAGGDAAQDYLVDGITDEVATALSNMGLQVPGRASTLAFKGKHPAPQEVGRALHVAAVMTGRWRALGTRVHVTAELASTASGIRLVSYSTDREANNFFTEQNAITRDIIDTLRARLRPRATTADHQTTNASAHELYLKANFQANLGSPEGLLRSVELYQSAIAADPRYALAYAGLSRSYGLLADGTYLPKDIYPRAVAAARTAIALDSTLSEGWSQAALLNANYEWDWPRARIEVERAKRLNPGNPESYLSESSYWLGVRRPDRAVEGTRQSAARDPLNPFSEWFLGVSHYLNGAPDSALAHFHAMRGLTPDFVYLDAYDGFAWFDKGQFTQAESAFVRADRLLGHRSAGLAWFYAKTRRTDEARLILRQIEAEWPKTYVVPELIATAYDALGDRDSFYRWLERGVEVHSAVAAFSGDWPPFRKYAADARFLAVLHRMHIPDRPAD